MTKAGQRKCMSCGEFFLPDHRSGERQRYCCAAACRRASKAASQASWLAKPPNHGRPLRVPGIVPKLLTTPGRLRTPAPKLGQHNTTVLGHAGWPTLAANDDAADRNNHV